MCGRVPDRRAPNDEALNEAIDKIKRAVRAGSLQIVGQPSDAEHLYDAQHLRPRDVTVWAAGKFPRFPLALKDLPVQGAVPETDRKQLDSRAETAYLNVIGALLHSLLKKGANGIGAFSSAAKIIETIQAEFPNAYGLSPRELQDKFAAAKRSLRSD